MPDVSQLLSWPVILALLAGTTWGVLLGCLPGITGLTALIMALPLALSLDPIPALVLLISIHAVADTGGAVTAIALAIPGTPSNAATIEDGHALAKAGHLRRTVATAAFASMLGGVLGFFLLCISLPLSLVLVKAAGAPEIFAISALGIVCAARLGSKSLSHGLASIGLGLFLGLIGTQQSTGIPRLWFSYEPLIDGLQLMAVATGLFAGPELVRLIVGDSDATIHAANETKPLRNGIIDTFQRIPIVIKASLVGWLVGLLPGVGGSVSGFLSYVWAGAARPGERTIALRRDGVVAAEAGNNAKEGGDLIPTLAIGVPGGAGMAVLLGVFATFGLMPGPTFANQHPDIVAGLAAALLISNVLGGVMVMLGSRLLVRMLMLPRYALAAAGTVLACLGVVAIRGEIFDLWIAVIFCAAGLAMIRYGFSRPALLLGFVLAPIIETYGAIAYKSYGLAFLLRPGVVIIALIAALIIFRGASALRVHSK